MKPNPLPTFVIWDITYACPLRCVYCYSESGRRSDRRLPLEDALRLSELLISMRPREVDISGGEPLLVKGLRQIAERFVAASVPVVLFTSGFGVDVESAAWIGRLFSEVHVSVDGADAATHDSIRGIKGSFESAMNALSLFDGGQVEFAVEVCVVQSNFHQLERICSEVARRFPRLRGLSLSAATPSGLASREGYAERELLSDEQRAALRDRELATRLKALAPTVARVSLFDSLGPQTEPPQIKTTTVFEHVMHIEPDGRVRGISQYEGTVGNILDEPAEVIWRRAQERQRDAFVVQELATVRTMKDWAAATRNIDRRFGSSADLIRISRRTDYSGTG